jgi:ABC-type transporter Mla subunit MlaD
VALPPQNALASLTGQHELLALLLATLSPALHHTQDLPAILEQLEASTATLATLMRSHLQLVDEAADTYWQLQHWPLDLQEELDAAAERIKGYTGTFQQQLLDDQQQLKEDLQQLQVCRHMRFGSACLREHPDKSVSVKSGLCMHDP